MMDVTPPADRLPGGHPSCIGVGNASPDRLTLIAGLPFGPRKGDTMIAAKQVKEIGPKMEWIAVEDHAGRVWKYKRVGPLDIAEPAQVEGHYVKGEPIRAVLVRDADGHVLLHGDGTTGMPRSICVRHVEDPTSPMLSVLGLAPKEEYVLVA